MKQSEKVRRALEDLIASGTLRPGERLDEERLAERFSVSRTPVREALLQLRSTGLVENEPRKSARVAQFGVDWIVEAFEFSAELERMCTRLAARRMTKGERNSLGDIVAQMGAVVRDDNVDAYTQENYRFHEAIYIGCHNQHAEAQARSFFAKLGPYRRQVLMMPRQLTISFDQHAEIAKAIMTGDELLAESLMKAHAGPSDPSFLEFVSMISRNVDRPRE